MSSRRLARLAALSEQRTEQRRRELAGTEHELSRLLQQHDELLAFADSYQAADRESASTIPSMLRIRRHFVGGVLDEANKLKAKIHERGQLLQQQQERHRRSASESLALDTLQQQASEQEQDALNRRERQVLDETGSRSALGRCATVRPDGGRR